jgi:hypothetical protein
MNGNMDAINWSKNRKIWSAPAAGVPAARVLRKIFHNRKKEKLYFTG